MQDSFRALLIENQDGHQRTGITEVSAIDLPEGDVTVQVAYSTLNYKDALAILGQGSIVRRFPMVPGIDFAGTVVESDSSEFRPGDRVLLNGWGVGERHWGGLAEYARVNSEWLTPLNEELSFKDAMSIGTAGYTAMLCIMTLERHGTTPESGEVLVTGASGGVGSFAIGLLANLGYEVAAATGRTHEEDFLLSLGAKRIVPRSQLSEPGKPLAKEQWAGAVDVVGGHVLANVCASTKYRGAVTACGLAGSIDFPATVAPFILRGVTLHGVDSVRCPKPERTEAWRRLAEALEPSLLDKVARVVSLDDCVVAASSLLAGDIRGRVVVEVSDT